MTRKSDFDAAIDAIKNSKIPIIHEYRISRLKRKSILITEALQRIPPTTITGSLEGKMQESYRKMLLFVLEDILAFNNRFTDLLLNKLATRILKFGTDFLAINELNERLVICCNRLELGIDLDAFCTVT